MMTKATIRVPGLKVAVPLAADALPRDLVPMDGPAGEPTIELVLEGGPDRAGEDQRQELSQDAQADRRAGRGECRGGPARGPAAAGRPGWAVRARGGRLPGQRQDTPTGRIGRGTDRVEMNSFMRPLRGRDHPGGRRILGSRRRDRSISFSGGRLMRHCRPILLVLILIPHAPASSGPPGPAAASFAGRVIAEGRENADRRREGRHIPDASGGGSQDVPAWVGESIAPNRRAGAFHDRLPARAGGPAEVVGLDRENLASRVRDQDGWRFRPRLLDPGPRLRRRVAIFRHRGRSRRRVSGSNRRARRVARGRSPLRVRELDPRDRLAAILE